MVSPHLEHTAPLSTVSIAAPSTRRSPRGPAPARAPWYRDEHHLVLRGFLEVAGPAEQFPGVGVRLSAHYVRACAVWRGTPLSPQTFGRRLGYVASISPDFALVLDELHTADLYLAAALLERSARAWAWFEPLFHAELARVTVAVSEDARSSVLRTSLVELLYGYRGQPPYVLGYAGQSPLRSFVAEVIANALGRYVAGAATPAPLLCRAS